MALERFDSSEGRLSKIRELIESSKYSIHDLSRIKSAKTREYYRLNMPFEIGLDFGCKFYHPDQAYQEKQVLIIEKEQYSYQKALSDLAGFDVRCYKDCEGLIITVRNWLSDFCHTKLCSGTEIWDDYNDFQIELLNDLKQKKFSDKEIDLLPFREYLSYIQEWIDSSKN
jgi:hypothetical protein